MSGAPTPPEGKGKGKPFVVDRQPKPGRSADATDDVPFGELADIRDHFLRLIANEKRAA